ncbi:MAG: phospholipid/cholesterol/gamma-HCH transport system ATP-binding protein [Betaproteobacteria bacterium]|jgi:phospholipid/cholesterol/gamma-HCH transport system ATP-binding protein
MNGRDGSDFTGLSWLGRVKWFRIRTFRRRLVAPAHLIEISDVSFAYDQRPILTGINMVIPRGKVVAIMGVSGSGKTTLLRLIGGVVKPTRGALRVAGQLVHELDQQGVYQLRRRMGMLFQFGALFTDLSVFDNVAFQMREHTSLPERMIRDLVMMKLHAVGLRGAHRLMPSELSGGMARRVALARAIALDPMLIMYDEPFTGLDPISLGVISNLIRRLNDALGATSIVVTHDVQEVLELVDYVYYLSDGRIVAQGTPDEMRASTDPLVRQFVYGEADGPVPFQYPSRAFAEDLKILH